MLKKIKIFIAPAITLLALYVIFKNLDVLSVLDIFKNSNKSILIISSMLTLILVIFFLSLRLKETMTILGCNLKYKEILKIYLAILPASKLSPANAGDFIRSYYFKDKVPPSIMAGTVFFERLIDILVISAMAIISGVIIKSKLSFLLGGLGFLMSLAFFFLFKKGFFLKNKGTGEKWKIFDKLSKFSVIFNLSMKNKKSFLKILLYTFLSWLSVMFYIALIFYALGSKVPILSITAFQPIVSYASFIPITISGIGARESVMLFLYGKMVPAPIILSAGLIFSLFTAFLMPLTGLPLMHKIIKKKQNGQQ